MNYLDDVKEREQLAARYPWLVCWREEGAPEAEYRFGLWLDAMPVGWATAFGREMCEDLAAALQEDGINPLDYAVRDVKEKYGFLRWDGNMFGRVAEVEAFYADLSEVACCECGQPASYVSLGWICPYCERCEKHLSKEGWKFRQFTAEEQEDAADLWKMFKERKG